MKDIIIVAKMLGLVWLALCIALIPPVLCGLFGLMLIHIGMLYGIPRLLAFFFGVGIAFGLGWVWGKWAEKHIRPRLLALIERVKEESI
jgi:peptidoglycan/LPS O-acetylase OafA/YrhL